MLHRISALIILFFFVMGCKQPERIDFSVSGYFFGATGKKIMLAELPFNSKNRIVVDSITLDSTGRFMLNSPQQTEGFYQLFIEYGPRILLINDVKNIEVTANVNDPENYAVSGSLASNNIKIFDKKLTALYKKARASSLIADSVSRISQMADSVKAPLVIASKTDSQNVQYFLKSAINGEKNATAQYYMLGTASRLLPRDQWEIQLEKALNKHPKHEGLLTLKTLQP